MPKPWNVLVVDDAVDVHGVTNLALKRKKWKNRGIAMTSAMSGAEARAILSSPDAPHFHVALVDVVMETDDAGLKVCQFIRANFPPTLRIILRTGQAGLAPEEAILNTYDIDHYLSKSEVTEGRLYGAVRACLRGSQDMESVLAMHAQLRSLTTALNDRRTTLATLVALMRQSLGFLEDRYAAKLTFVPNIEGAEKAPDAEAAQLVEAVERGIAAGLETMTLHPGEPLGARPDQWVVLVSSLDGKAKTEDAKVGKLARWFNKVFESAESQQAKRAAGIVVQFEAPSELYHDEFLLDLELFMTNWMLVKDVFTLRDGELPIAHQLA